MQTYYQKGLGLKAEVAPLLDQDYGSSAILRLKELGYAARVGELTIRLAKEFGFCYGVDRAIEYAYEARKRFPDRRLFLSGEIIHNPSVNRNLQEMGYTILADEKDPVKRYVGVQAGDVVVLPAFGVTVQELKHLKTLDAVLVDTTCGSVLNVWKNVSKYAKDGFTVVIHGKHYHEETRATASQALLYPGGAYICVRDEAETAVVCDFVLGKVSREAFLERFAPAISQGFDPDLHLQRVGLANQTTMLMSESLRVQEMLRQAFRESYGESGLVERFRSFDTICSATQDRQDAVLRLFDETPPDLMLVIGGYNSSNTQALVRICAARCPTFYIESPECIDALTGELLYRDLATGTSERRADWLPRTGATTLGITAGASTPDSVVARSIARLLSSRGASIEDLKSL